MLNRGRPPSGGHQENQREDESSQTSQDGGAADLPSPPGDSGEEPQDWSLFEELIGPVSELDRRHGPAVPARPKPGEVPAEDGSGAASSAGESWSGFSVGIPTRKERRALQSGRVEVGAFATLDLHGHTVKQACSRLRPFLLGLREDGHRHAVIITGRGARSSQGVPVLKPAVLDFISESGADLVVWMAEAPPQLGGPGALVLKLRRPR